MTTLVMVHNIGHCMWIVTVVTSLEKDHLFMVLGLVFEVY